jgi:hypothetical protein
MRSPDINLIRINLLKMALYAARDGTLSGGTLHKVKSGLFFKLIFFKCTSQIYFKNEFQYLFVS